MIASLAFALLLMDVRGEIAHGTGVVELPAGETHIDRPLQIPRGSKGLTIRGAKAGSVLVMDAGFRGRAAVDADETTDLTLSGFTIRGNRTDLRSDRYLPRYDETFADYYPDNGVVIRESTRVVVRDVRFTLIRSFPVIVQASAHVVVDRVGIEDCGTLNPAGRNNTSGGILLEEGVSDFEVAHSSIERIAGNAIWTHSNAHSPRASDGWIHNNHIAMVGRDAIQVGHATRVRVVHNTGVDLGYPADIVDVESHGVAVALDTAGNVDLSSYEDNVFKNVNGQCIDLDGFHDGSVERNTCVNDGPLSQYPALHCGIVFGNNDPAATSSNIRVVGNKVSGFAYGGIFLIGRGNALENNTLSRLNLAHCGTVPIPAKCAYALDQPDLLRSGIYLGAGAGREAETRDNVIRGNRIDGFGMDAHCVGTAPGVSRDRNYISENTCSVEPPRPLNRKQFPRN